MLDKHLKQIELFLSDVTDKHKDYFSDFKDDLYFSNFPIDFKPLFDKLFPQSAWGSRERHFFFFFDMNQKYIGTCSIHPIVLATRQYNFREITQKALLLNAFYVGIISERIFTQRNIRYPLDYQNKIDDFRAKAGNKERTNFECEFCSQLVEILEQLDIKLFDFDLLLSPGNSDHPFTD